MTTLQDTLVVRRPRIHATHDQACAVCHEGKAVLDCQTNLFSPCWACQDKGWETVRLSRLAQWTRWIWKAQ